MLGSPILGMNAMRVFLHDLLYTNDKQGFLDRLNQHLTGFVEPRHKDDSHHIRRRLESISGVRHPTGAGARCPQLRLAAITGTHDPRRSRRHTTGLEPYAKWVFSTFDGDDRVSAFEVYNEPGQNNNFWMQHQSAVSELPSKSGFSQALLTKVFGWAREVNPEQPIFSSAWKSQQWTDRNNAFIGWENKDSIDHYVFEHSDIIGYHDYQIPEKFSAVAEGLTTQFGDRPVLNTEWMARSVPNTLLTNLPVLNRHGIGAVNWGLVNGKIQTIYPWSSWQTAYTVEPDPWFHDLLNADGTPHDAAEATLMRQLTGTTSTPRTAPINRYSPTVRIRPEAPRH